MGYLANAGGILIEVLFGLLIGLFVLRMLLQLVRANFYNPICQFFYKATNPLLMPMRRVLKPWKSLDLAALLVALLLCAIKVWLLAALAGFGLPPLATVVLAIATLLDFLLPPGLSAADAADRAAAGTAPAGTAAARAVRPVAADRHACHPAGPRPAGGAAARPRCRTCYGVIPCALRSR